MGHREWEGNGSSALENSSKRCVLLYLKKRERGISVCQQVKMHPSYEVEYMKYNIFELGG